MSENEKFTVNDAICDMLEVLHTAGKCFIPVKLAHISPKVGGHE